MDTGLISVEHRRPWLKRNSLHQYYTDIHIEFQSPKDSILSSKGYTLMFYECLYSMCS